MDYSLIETKEFVANLLIIIVKINNIILNRYYP